ncbi:MAG: dihydropteroate synthase [Azospirillum brasilense]|nr:MAG: dihydropteroate synthase [Azospirillum brasilense]
MKPARPQLMGILNLTPDSFSADGVTEHAVALARFEALVNDGATIIDIGAESTRPGATALSDAEEWARLEPLLQALQAHPLRAAVRLSLDSYHPATMRRALALGVDIINDVTGLRDDAMLDVARASTADIVVMHALSVPVVAGEVLPADTDMRAFLSAWRAEMLSRAVQAGIAPERLIFDPGLGFGKTANQNYAILAAMPQLVVAGERWLVGHSRKSFLKAALGVDASITARDDATLALSAMLTQMGVHMLRVHDVARHRALLDALCM